MSDLETLHDAWGTPEAPSDTTHAEARAALMAHAAERPSRRRVSAGLPLPRAAAVGAFALAIAIGATMVASLGGTGPDGGSTSVVPGLPGVPVASAAVLERAAVAAEKKPFTAPRDDQWIYFEERFTPEKGGEAARERQWRRADGGGFAFIDEHGELHVEMLRRPKERSGRPVPLGPFAGYKELAALPTDPDALRRWAYEQTEKVTGGGTTEHGDVYLIFNGILRENVLPPELEAAIFRALKGVPGVTVETMDIFGKPAIALALEAAGWLREELLLDRETYTYRGERSTIVREATINPLKAGNSTGEVKEGSQVIGERLVTAIVDEPGERP